MNETRRHDDNGVAKYMKLWPIVFALATIAVAWGVITATVNTASNTSTRNKEVLVVHGAQIAVLQNQILTILNIVEKMDRKLDYIVERRR